MIGIVVIENPSSILAEDHCDVGCLIAGETRCGRVEQEKCCWEMCDLYPRTPLVQSRIFLPAAASGTEHLQVFKEMVKIEENQYDDGSSRVFSSSAF